MHSLQALPEELLQSIALEIQSSRDILAFALQCRKFHRIADLDMRRKYRTVELTDNRSRCNREKCFDILLAILHQPVFGSYVRHLQYRSPGSSLGVLGGWPMCKNERRVSAEDTTRLKSVVQYIVNNFNLKGMQEPTIWNILLGDTSPGWGSNEMRGDYFQVQAIGALLVCLSPQLESLSIASHIGVVGSSSTHKPDELVEGVWTGDFLLDLLLLNAFAQGKDTPIFRNLRTVNFLNIERLVDTDYEYAPTLYDSELQLVHRLPGIETVRFDGTRYDQDCENDCGPLDFVPRRQANYSTIEFFHSFVPGHILYRIILSSRVLRSFTFKVGGRSLPATEQDPWDHLFDPYTIFKALSVHKDTLEELDLDIEHHVNLDELFHESQDSSDAAEETEEEEEDENEEDEETNEVGTLTYLPLASFHLLKRLSVGPRLLYCCALLGEDENANAAESTSIIDRLPQSLIHLRIYGLDKDEEDTRYLTSTSENRGTLVRHLTELLAKCESKLLPLKTIEGINEYIPEGKTLWDLD